MSKSFLVIDDASTSPRVERMSMGTNITDVEGVATIAGVTGGATAGTPASAAATGVKGTVQFDDEYLYVCVETNTWVRIPLATWS